MFGLFNGFLGVTDFLDSIASSFLNAFDVLIAPINYASFIFETLGTLSIIPDIIWLPFSGILAVLIVMNIVKLLNYLPLW